MDRLLQELLERGEVSPVAIEWAREHAGLHGGSLTAALLELELIDEEGLVRALEASFGFPAARLDDLLELDPHVGMRLPPRLRQEPTLCPLRLDGGRLTLLASRPVPELWEQELRLFGIQLAPLAAPEHYLELARSQVYGMTLDAHTSELEHRLERRRQAPDVGTVAASLAETASAAAAASILLEFASVWVEHAALLVCHKNRLRVVARRGSSGAPSATLPLPGPGCTVAAAVCYGGYFVGPLGGSAADEEFCRTLGRPLARWAFVAPVPVAEAATVVLYADNGPRGMAMRWLADLSLLAARLGQHVGRLGGLGRRAEPKAASAETRPVAAAEPAVEPATEPELLPVLAPAAPSAAPPEVERMVLDRLRRAAEDAGMALDLFVEELLRRRSAAALAPAATDSAVALADEVKGLFARLATDIPAQLARGMEAAFRNLVPRLSRPPPPPAPGPSSASGAAPEPLAVPRPAPLPSAGIEPVSPTEASREVATYQSRRRSSTRIKL
jgi:hypothetical protein